MNNSRFNYIKKQLPYFEQKIYSLRNNRLHDIHYFKDHTIDISEFVQNNIVLKIESKMFCIQIHSFIDGLFRTNIIPCENFKDRYMYYVLPKYIRKNMNRRINKYINFKEKRITFLENLIPPRIHAQKGANIVILMLYIYHMPKIEFTRLVFERY